MLQIRKNEAGAAVKGRFRTVDPVLLFNGKQCFKFGPMSETATLAFRIGSPAYDVRAWARWQQEHGMGYVRVYPEQGYGWVDTGAEGRLYPFEQVGPLIFDLDKFNPEYWENMRAVAQCLREHDIVMHLQLVQVAFFKEWAPEARRWQQCFWNPVNNVNEWTRDLKPTFPFSDRNEAVIDHWKRYVHAVLDATGDSGNLLLDIGNELGGASEWVDLNLDFIEEWEKEHGSKLVKGVDFTHIDQADSVLGNPRLDVIITHGEFVNDAPMLRRVFGRPVVTVISRDSEYLGLGQGAPNEDRFRRFHYRCLMNKVQGIGDYGKMMGGQEPLRTGDTEFALVDIQSERVRKFAQEAAILSGFFESLVDFEKLNLRNATVLRHPHGATVYCLKSDQEVIVYLEAGMNAANDGMEYAAGLLDLAVLTASDRQLLSTGRAEILHPSSGARSPVAVELRDRGEADRNYPAAYARIALPAFRNDLLVHAKAK